MTLSQAVAGYRRKTTADVSSVADRIGAQLLIAIDKASAHHAVDHFALEAPTVIDGEAGVGVHARVVRDPCPVEIDDGEVGIPADGNGSLVLTPHRAGRVLAQDAGDRVQGQTALVITLAEQHGQQSLEAGKTRRGLPDTASLRRNVAVHVVGRDDVDAARLQGRPQRLRIARSADRGADLAEVAPFPVYRVRQVVRACLDGQVGAQPALRQCCLQRRCRRAMHHVDWSTRLAGERRNAMNRLRLDKGGPRVVPGRKATFALRIRRHEASAQHPCDLDVLAMRTENAPTARDRLRETEQKAVIDIRQANAHPFAAAAVHKKLEGGNAVRLRVVRHAGKLLLRRDHQMQAEVDAAAGGGDRANLVNQGRLKRLSRDDVGEKCGHPASRGRSRTRFRHRWRRAVC